LDIAHPYLAGGNPGNERILNNIMNPIILENDENLIRKYPSRNLPDLKMPSFTSESNIESSRMMKTFVTSRYMKSHLGESSM